MNPKTLIHYHKRASLLEMPERWKIVICQWMKQRQGVSLPKVFIAESSLWS